MLESVRVVYVRYRRPLQCITRITGIFVLLFCIVCIFILTPYWMDGSHEYQEKGSSRTFV